MFHDFYVSLGLDVSVVEVPYSDDAFSLLLLLPGKQTEFVAGGLERLEGNLDAQGWDKIVRGLRPVRVDLQVPIFTHR